MAASYLSVSPRLQPGSSSAGAEHPGNAGAQLWGSLFASHDGAALATYNAGHKELLARVAGGAAFPAFLLMHMCRGADTDVNAVVGAFVGAFIVGYPVLLLVETAAATLMRLLVLRVLEPAAFRLCPRLPAIFLPWQLREHGYEPKRVTLFAFSLLTTCFVAPVVEEGFKMVRPFPLPTLPFFLVVYH
jgi:hypothetical protein